MSDLELIGAFSAFLLTLLVALLLGPSGRKARASKRSQSQSTTPSRAPRAARDLDQIPANAILVDGSNVMHWGGEPATVVIVRVVADLIRAGLVPYVCFDANAGYKLEGRYMSARDLAPLIGLPAHQVFVVDKGVAADEALLEAAESRSLQVVSNDRFRDWTGLHPWVKDYKRFRRGTWKEGSVVWQSGRRR